jgi:D-glycerate 3-kinase
MSAHRATASQRKSQLPEVLDRILEVVEGAAVRDALDEEKLPATYHDALRRHIAPVAAHLVERLEAADRPLLIGINGCQGSGKSTLARFLALLCEQAADLRCPELSIDDLYHTRATRERLGSDVHPLLVTRGVPGTHDLALGTTVLDALLDADRKADVAIPRFAKSVDDRLPVDQWPRWAGRADAVLFEGWCVACTAEPEAALATPINALERNEDPGGEWRRYVNMQLQLQYAQLFGRIDVLVFLQAPSFECVHDWRRKQEQKLRERLEREGAPPEARSRVMSDAQIDRFIQHYERLTRHMLASLPARADAVIRLGADHQLTAHELRS